MRLKVSQIIKATALVSILGTTFSSKFVAAQQSMDISRLSKIALMRCAEIQETRKMDSSMRVRIVNDFRLDADLDPFLRGDDYLVEAVEYGLCPELLMQSSDFESKFARAKELKATIEARREEQARDQRESDKIAKGKSISERLSRTISSCDLEYRDYDIKFEGSSLKLWGKMFQGSRVASCRLDLEGSGVAFQIYLKGEDQPYEYRPARFSTSRAPFGEAVYSEGARSLSKKDKRDISSIELVVDGLPKSSCASYSYDIDSCPVWPEGLEIKKRVHTAKR